MDPRFGIRGVREDTLRPNPAIEALLGLTWEELGPGVHGYAAEVDGAIYYGIVQADNEGNGDVGRWLDALPTDRTHRICNVVNPRLEGMLRRRKWSTHYEWFDAAGEEVLCFEKAATT